MSQSSMVNSSGVASEYGVVTEPRTLRLERVLPGPIERVWAYLTESEKRGKWLASGDMETREGGQVKLVFHNTKLSAHDDPIPERYRKHEGTGFEAHILRCDPPRLLSFTWGSKEDSEVSFELTPQGSEVLLVVTHSRLPNRQTLLSVSGGWHAHLGILSALLEGREPGPFWSEIERLEAEYDQRIPAE